MPSINLKIAVAMSCGWLASQLYAQPGLQLHSPYLALASHAALGAIPVSALHGREDDARVEQIAARLAVAGRVRCATLEPYLGFVLQHLSQFELADRPGMIARQGLGKGPGVIAVVPGSPAAAAGIRPGDVLVAIAGRALPPEAVLSMTFDAALARERADAIQDLLENIDTPSLSIAALRNNVVFVVDVTPQYACPHHVHLARSNQRNAYADGRHVFLTTGLLSRLKNDDELAFIVAHEMAHNILHHATIMRSDSVKHGLGRTLGRSGRIVREAERVADAFGGELMIDAGFDPVRGVAIIKRLGGGDLGVDTFAAHDSAGKRIAAMRALADARHDQ